MTASRDGFGFAVRALTKENTTFITAHELW
jgi:hypothetical protein